MELSAIIKRIASQGLVLTPDAFEELKKCPPELIEKVAEKAVDVAIKSQLAVVDAMIINVALYEIRPEQLSSPMPETKPAVIVTPQTPSPIKPEAVEVTPSLEEVDSGIKIFSPSIQISKKPLEGYVKYFNSRYEKISKIFLARGVSHVPIANIQRLPDNETFTVIGLVREKRAFRDKIFIDIDDPTGSTSVFVPANADPKLVDDVESVTSDVVCAFTAKKTSLNILKEVLFPEVPFRTLKGGENDVYAVLTGDFHFGSKSLLHHLLKKFEMWLNGEVGTPELREIGKNVKYIIIAGDVAEGIGVYPDQLADLEIINLQEQYDTAARYFSELPERIKIIASPGNHDATQQALPQPFPAPQFAKPFYGNPRIHLVPNPCLVDLEGVKILVYHGQGIEDVAQKIAGIRLIEPAKAMQYFLKVRHLAPVYGGKTAIAPNLEDELVITEVPHVLHTGHIHIFSHTNYRGTIAVSGGAWQKQTDYQIKQGITPTPGIIIALNLKTLKITPIDLNLF